MSLPAPQIVERLAWSIDEAAAAVGVTPRHMRNLIERGQIRTVRLGRRRVIPAAVLAEVLDGGDES